MKKLLTLLIAAGAITGANAQDTREEARRVILGNPKNAPNNGSTNPRDVILGGGNNDNGTGKYPGSGDAQVDAINREYDAKIQSVRNNPYLSAEEKDRQIRQLERDRQRRIREVRGTYGDDDDNKDKKNKKYKKNKKDNGKHLGWEKGKGNPQRRLHRPSIMKA